VAGNWLLAASCFFKSLSFYCKVTFASSEQPKKLQILQAVTHFISLGFQIQFVVFVALDFEWDVIYNFKSIPDQASAFGWVVGH
jgi:hypothetical protein